MIEEPTSPRGPVVIYLDDNWQPTSKALATRAKALYPNGRMQMLVLSGVAKGGPGSGNFGHAGRSGEVGGSGPAGGGLNPHLDTTRRALEQEPDAARIREHMQNVKQLATSAAKEFDFPAKRIDVAEYGGGIKLAEYHPESGRITVYADRLGRPESKYQVKEILAHEVEHAKFHTAFPDSPKFMYAGDTTLGPTLEAFIKANGGFYTFAKTGETISNYTAIHWQRLKEGNSANLLAIHETLAEMERRRVAFSKLSRAEYGKHFGGPWGKLYAEVVRKAG